MAVGVLIYFSLASFIAATGRADRDITEELGCQCGSGWHRLRPGLIAVMRIGPRSAPCFNARQRWFQDCACLVNANSIGGCQGNTGCQVMVAAQ